MKPEPPHPFIDTWMLAKLGVDVRTKGYTLLPIGELYRSLNDAQQAQTFEALNSGMKYEIFHLEWPCN